MIHNLPNTPDSALIRGQSNDVRTLEFAGGRIDELRPLNQKVIEEKIRALHDYMEQFGVGSGKLLKCEKIADGVLTSSLAEAKSALKIAATFPSAMVIDLDKVLALKGKYGLPACAAYSTEESKATIFYTPAGRPLINVIYTNRTIQENEKENVLLVDRRDYATEYPRGNVPGLTDLYTSARIRNARIGQGRRGYADTVLLELNPSASNGFHKLKDSIFDAISGMDKFKEAPAPRNSLWKAFTGLTEHEAAFQARRSIQSVMLTHEFGEKIIPAQARHQIEEAISSGLFKEVLIVAEATEWQVRFETDLWWPQRYESGIPNAQRVTISRANDPLIVGFDGHRHYLLGKFDLSPFENWVSAEFSTHLRETI